MTDQDDGIIVRFVKVNNESSDVMQQAFSGLSEVGARCVWFVPADCLSVTKRDKRIFYVFDSFTSRFFGHIVSTGSRIYGPMCILQCLKNGEHLPRLSHPVFSKAMEGLIISCTNIPSDLRDELHQRVVWMMGEVSKDFLERVTHLVAGEVGSKKCTVAVTLRKKIMLPEWVSAVWERSHKEMISADDSQFNSLRCPPFRGYVICVSGFDTDERARIKNIVENAGGQYSGEMKINECTHLVVTAAQGQKYEFARKWKINIVGPQWIHDCVSSNYCLSEHLYAVEKQPVSNSEKQRSGLTSTPTSEGLEAVCSSSLVNLSAVSMTTVNDTAISRQLCTTSLPTQDQGTRVRESLPSRGPTKTTKESVAELLESIDVTGAKAGFFLDGCKIYINGVSSTHLEKVRRIINLGGGTRFNQINDSVSHVVVGEIDDESIQKLQLSCLSAKVVFVRWLVDCFRRGQWLPEEEYLCLSVPESVMSLSPPDKRLLKKNQKSDENRDRSRLEFVVNKSLTKETNVDDMHEVLSQYMTNTGSLGESTLLKAAEVGDELVGKIDRNASMTTSEVSRRDDESTMYVPPNVDEGVEMDDDEATDHEITRDGPMFADLKFMVFGFESDEEQLLSDLIKQQGGTVLPRTSRSIADYGVVPLFGCPVKVTVGDVVTSAWLQMSVENEKMLPIDSSVIYTPIPFVPNARPLQGCVLSVSGYSGIERDVLLEISHALGGTCQDYFLRRPKGTLLASTHLIVKSAEGSKYDAAKKWKIPAINKMWLFESARTGKRVNVERFLIDVCPDDSFSDTSSGQTAVKPATVPPPAVTSSNKRQSDCPAESINPAKRSRCGSAIDVSAKENSTTSDNHPSASPLSRRTSNLDTVFKAPAPPSSAASTRTSANAASRAVLTSGLEFGVTKNDGFSKISNGKDLFETKNSEEEKADLPAAVPVKRGAALVKEMEEVANNGSPLLKKRSPGKATSADKCPETVCDESKVASKRLEVAGEQSECGSKQLEAAETESRNSGKASEKDVGSVLDEFVSTKTSTITKVGQTALVENCSTTASKKNSLAKTAISGKTKGKGVLSESENRLDKTEDPFHRASETPVAPNGKAKTGFAETPKNIRLKELIQGARSESPLPVVAPSNADDVDTPSKFMGSEVFHPKLDLNGVLSPWASPVDQARKQSRVSLPLEEVFAENIGIAVKNSMSSRGSDDSFSQKMQDVDYCSISTETVSGPLKGVVIAVAKKLSKNQTEYNNMASSLGAEYRWTYDSGCTHFIFQGRLNDINKEFRMARDQGKFVVSPHWLLVCEEQKSRADESSYPHTYNPNLSLSITGQKTPARPTRTALRQNVLRASDRAAVQKDNVVTNATDHTVASAKATETAATLSVASSRTTKTVVVSLKTAEPVSSDFKLNSKSDFKWNPKSSNKSDDFASAGDSKSSNNAAKPTPVSEGAVSLFDEPEEAATVDAVRKDFEDATLSDEDMAVACGNLENQERSCRESSLLDGLKRLNEASRVQGRGKPVSRILSSEKEGLDTTHDSKLNLSVQDTSVKEDDVVLEGNKPSKEVDTKLATTEVTAKSLSTDDDTKSVPSDTKSSEDGQPSETPKVPGAPKTNSDANTQPSQFVEVIWEETELMREQRAANKKNCEPSSNGDSGPNKAERPAAKTTSVNSDREPTNQRIDSRSRSGISRASKNAEPPKNSPANQSEDQKQSVVQSEAQKSSNEGARSSRSRQASAIAEPTGVRENESSASKDKKNTKPVFLFSGLSAEERDSFAAVIANLGGLAVDTANFISECTHLIIEKPTRNEKYLACVATGKWILHKSYVDACIAAGTFLPENEYEWGGNMTAAHWSTLPVQAVKLAEAAHRWRNCLSKAGTGASTCRGSFEKWTVLILTESRREDGFKRLLEAGGATVAPNKLPIDYSNVTHAFIDLTKIKYKIDLEGMVCAGVLCLKPEYIASFLTDDPIPDPVQFFIPEAKCFR